MTVTLMSQSVRGLTMRNRQGLNRDVSGQVQLGGPRGVRDSYAICHMRDFLHMAYETRSVLNFFVTHMPYAPNAPYAKTSAAICNHPIKARYESCISHSQQSRMPICSFIRPHRRAHLKKPTSLGLTVISSTIAIQPHRPITRNARNY
jgi:hypothetical protein